MPLHGKIVVIKRSGGDGTEFPLTTTCLFGRKPDCDIRIQLPHVSKEHCRIDLNENKEVILTNLSTTCPTRVNGEPLNQSERLKHGDMITIVDRSFRFEYPPAPTPKKRPSNAGKPEKVLHNQQVGDAGVAEKGEKTSEVFTDPHLKDGAYHDNIQRSLEKTVAVDSNEDGSELQSKADSPFSDLYQMIKMSLGVKTPRKSCVSQVQTPSSKFCTPKPGSAKKNNDKSFTVTPKKDEAKVITEDDGKSNECPQSVKKQGELFKVPSSDMVGLKAKEAESATKAKATLQRERNSAPPQKFTVCEIVEQISAQSPKPPLRRRSKELTPAKPAGTHEQEDQAVMSLKTECPSRVSPRNLEKAEKVKEVSKKRKSVEAGQDVLTPQKRKHVSFGGYLSPELFDKRLPPDSPLQKGATPRRSLTLYKPKLSLIRRASVIGLMKGRKNAKKETPSPKKSQSQKSSTPETQPGKKLPKSRSPSPKAAAPAQKTPKSRSASPKVASPAQKTPKPRSPSPTAASPAQKTPKSRSASPKAASPAQKTPKSRSPSPKAASPAQKTPKSRSPSPKGASPKRKSLQEMPTNASLIDVTPAKTPSNAGVKTPTVQGRFSVSRISTPSPSADADTLINHEPVVTISPKIQLKSESMTSSLHRTPGPAKSAAKILKRRSGVSRASMKCSWADRVKFGQAKAQVVAPTKKVVSQKTTKKTVPKPQTPARRFKDHMSTGHAQSPVTIVVGRAHSRAVAHPPGAAPRLVSNTAALKKDVKMGEDLSGVSEMFKTPLNERKKGSLTNESTATKTPPGGLSTSEVDTLLRTPEESGEMIVSPLTVTSMVKSRLYNSEAVLRLLNGGNKSSLVRDTPPKAAHSESPERLCADLKTPKQKTELPAGLTGVKRIMKTPRQKAEPLEDLRGRLLKTPKQKIGQQECLTGVRRIMKTPRQKAEPLEDIRGKLLVTPKQKVEQRECLTGVKRIFKTPKEKAEPIEDLRGRLLKTPKRQHVSDMSFVGVKELLETPNTLPISTDSSETPDEKPENTESTGTRRTVKTPRVKNSPVVDMIGLKRLMRTPKEKGEPVEEHFGIQRLMKSPKMKGDAAVEDFEGLKELMEEPSPDPTGKMEASKDQAQMSVDSDVHEAKAPGVAADGHSEVMSGCGVSETETHCREDADDGVPHQQLKLEENSPEVETSVGNVAEMETAAKNRSDEKKSARTRTRKVVESKEADDKKEAPEASEQLAAVPPVRGRRAKKTEVTAPPAVRTTRGRNAKTTDARDVEPTVEESVPEPSQVAGKPKRGRIAKKAPSSRAGTKHEDGTEIETSPELESEQNPPVDIEHNANKSRVAVEKPKRGRRAKQPEQSGPQQQDPACPPPEDDTQGDIRKDEKEESSDQPGTNENKSPEAMETVLQTPENENVPDVETAAFKLSETSASVVQKKSVRGRRAKLAETKEADDKQEDVQESGEPVIPAPVRGRRGKKVEAVAPPAGRQTRTRNAKSQEASSDQPAAETEARAEVVESQAALIITSQEKEDSAPPVKSLRGRKTKSKAVQVEQAQHHPEETELMSLEHHEANTEPEPQGVVPPAAGRPKRGRKMTPGSVEQKDSVDDSSLPLEAKQESQPPTRPKRGRNAKLEEEGKMEDVTTTAQDVDSEEPAKKLRRTRKAEQDRVESKDEVQTVGVADLETPPTTELVVVAEDASLASKPKRGGRKAKPDIVASSTDKPKRGRRQVPDEAATAENPEHNVELEEQKKAQPAVQITKPARARGAKTSVKDEASQAVPVKRARRGAALSLETPPEETTALQPESVPAANDLVVVSSEQTNQPEESSKTVPEETKKSKRCVKWKSELEVFDIPKETPVKVVRGRRAKPADQVDVKSKAVSRNANKSAAERLSDDVPKAQPVKRGRRGAKEAAETKSQEEEVQPKTRRGRSTNK